MSVIDFYDQLAAHYHLIFADWHATIEWQSDVLDALIQAQVPAAPNVRLLDCACGIGTQAIGLARHGYTVTATDISPVEVERARQEAASASVDITFDVADFRTLARHVGESFEVIIACDNAIPHLLTDDELAQAASNLWQSLTPGGLVLLSIRDYDAVAVERPHATPVRVYDEPERRMVFQVWDWEPDSLIYTLNQFILIPMARGCQTLHLQTRYRALLRDELTGILQDAGFESIMWHMPDSSGYYQPIVTARKHG